MITEIEFKELINERHLKVFDECLKCNKVNLLLYGLCFNCFNKPIYVIAFKDDNKEYYFKEEIKDLNNEFLDYEKVLKFSTKDEAKKGIKDYTDNQAYDFYIKKVNYLDIIKKEVV